MKLEDVAIIDSEVDWQECLQHWVWLLEGCYEFSIYIVTKFAELLVVDNNGGIWFLSTSAASFKQIAKDDSELFTMLDIPEEADFIFMPQVIRLLEAEGMTLGKNECYGFITPNVFAECEFNASNFRVTDISKYLVGLGNMLGKLKDTKNGQKVEYKVIP